VHGAGSAGDLVAGCPLRYRPPAEIGFRAATGREGIPRYLRTCPGPRARGLAHKIEWRTVNLMSRILIVEDDPAILCGLRDNLEFESHQVFTAVDGEAGYKSVCESAPDLVILDLMLPKLNG
jgi:hypothetical protein